MKLRQSWRKRTNSGLQEAAFLLLAENSPKQVWGGHVDVLELLLAHGADVNAKTEKGQTAISLAKEKGHTEIVELLRKHGAKE